MVRPSSLGPQAHEKGTVAELAHDVVLLVSSDGLLRTARGLVDDDRIDRLVYASTLTNRSLFVQPKGALTLQRGRSYEFRVPITDLPADPSTYFAALLPIGATAPWIEEFLWLVPGRALLAGAKGLNPRVIRVPRAPDPSNPWEAYRIPRSALATAYARALGIRLPRAKPRLPSPLSETAQAFVVETALSIHLTIGSGGAIQGWTPRDDRQGLDAAVNFVGSPVFMGLQPKGSFGRRPDGLIQVHVPRDTFHPSPFSFLIIAEFNPSSLSLGEFSWFIPTQAIAERVARSRDAFVFKVSPNPRSTKDNFLPWRYPTAELPAVLATALAALAKRGGPRPLPSLPHEIEVAGRAILGPSFAKVARDPARLGPALRKAVLRPEAAPRQMGRPRAFK